MFASSPRKKSFLLSEEFFNNKMDKIPEGLIRCEVCGEYKGKAKEKEFNWEGSFDQDKKEKSDEYIGISCLCDGILCLKCKKNKIHRPISNSYFKENNTMGHHPYFSGMNPCAKCQNQKKEEDRTPAPRMYINIEEMVKAGMSKEEVIERVKGIFREKGFLK